MTTRERETTQKPMPKYRCQELRALKIVDVMVTEDGTSLLFGEGFDPIDVSPEWAQKHSLRAGGYYVVHEDGQTSYIHPNKAEEFERRYTLVSRK